MYMCALYKMPFIIWRYETLMNLKDTILPWVFCWWNISWIEKGVCCRPPTLQFWPKKIIYPKKNKYNVFYEVVCIQKTFRVLSNQNKVIKNKPYYLNLKKINIYLYCHITHFLCLESKKYFFVFFYGIILIWENSPWFSSSFNQGQRP